MIFNKFISL